MKFLCLLPLVLLPTTALACSGSLHIELAEAGVYALDQATIAAAQPGLADCRSEALRLTQGDREVPLHIEGERDGRFGPGARLLWRGEPLHGPQSWFDAYSLNNVYLLSAATGTHARYVDAAPVDAPAATLRRRAHLEEENLMIRLNQSHVKLWEEPDFWHWAKLTHVDAQPFETRFDLADLATGGAAAQLSLTFRGLSEVPRRLQGETPPDHRVEIDLNGRTLGAYEWSGGAEVVHTLAVPPALLQAKDNLLRLHVPVRHALPDATTPLVDVVMFNRAEVDYPAAGDLDAAAGALRAERGGAQLLYRGAAPQLFGSDGRRYLARAVGPGRWRFAAAGADTELQPLLPERALAPLRLRAVSATEWRTPAEGADYLIVAHPRLLDAVRPLAEFHRARGLKVAVLDVDDVYDQFNHGIPHPQAIRNLVDQAWHRWPAPRPRFLLLVGDASFDIRHKKIDRLNLAKWADRELLQGPGFGDIPSTPYSDTPDDLPNRNLIPTWQFASYDGQSASDNHFASVGEDPMRPVLAVGRFPVVQPDEVKAIVDKTITYLRSPSYGEWRRDTMFITDESDYFKQSSDQIVAALGNQGFVADRVYASPQEKDNLAHQAAIKDGLNQGRLLVHFLGHGGRYIWRTGPPDLRKNHDLFGLDDVAHLSNGGRLPMVLSMTCYSAPFDNPTEDSIGEKFLREPNKGAVAVFAASWRNSPSPAYSKDLIENLLKPGTTIGEAIVAAKAKNGDATLVETYNLLGDPALILERPADQLRLVRSQGVFGHERIEATVQPEHFDGKVSADWLDASGKVLAASRFAVRGRRFVLPVPAAAAGASELRVYAADPDRAWDGIGRLALPPPPGAAAAPVAKPTAPAEVPRTFEAPPPPVPQVSAEEAAKRPDRILRNGFDAAGGAAAPSRAALAQGGGGCGDCANGHSSRSALRK